MDETETSMKPETKTQRPLMPRSPAAFARRAQSGEPSERWEMPGGHMDHCIKDDGYEAFPRPVGPPRGAARYTRTVRLEFLARLSLNRLKFSIRASTKRC
jgi:hypothetical protein